MPGSFLSGVPQDELFNPVVRVWHYGDHRRILSMAVLEGQVSVQVISLCRTIEVDRTANGADIVDHGTAPQRSMHDWTINRIEAVALTGIGNANGDVGAARGVFAVNKTKLFVAAREHLNPVEGSGEAGLANIWSERPCAYRRPCGVEGAIDGYVRHGVDEVQAPGDRGDGHYCNDKNNPEFAPAGRLWLARHGRKIADLEVVVERALYTQFHAEVSSLLRRFFAQERREPVTATCVERKRWRPTGRGQGWEFNRPALIRKPREADIVLQAHDSFWPSTSIRCLAAVFLESEHKRTLREREENGAIDPEPTCWGAATFLDSWRHTLR
jgi:hypothetical protein